METLWIDAEGRAVERSPDWLLAVAGLAQTAEAIDRDHPDWQFWHDEQLDHDRLTADEPTTLKGRAAKSPPKIVLAVDREEAAEALSMSVDHFERYVKPDLQVVTGVGRKLLFPVAALETWMTDHSAKALR